MTAEVTATTPHNASPELTATTAYSMVAASRQVAALKHGRGQVRGWPLDCDVLPLNIKGAARCFRSNIALLGEGAGRRPVLVWFGLRVS